LGGEIKLFAIVTVPAVEEIVPVIGSFKSGSSRIRLEIVVP